MGGGGELHQGESSPRCSSRACLIFTLAQSLIESIQSVPVKTLKMLARRVVDEEQCPPTAAHDILQTTLKVLFSRQELDV